jgi:hypothetical protein
LFERNLSGVPGRHRRGRVSHLLTDDGGVDTSEFPSTVAATSKGMHAGLLHTQSFESRM